MFRNNNNRFLDDGFFTNNNNGVRNVNDIIRTFNFRACLIPDDFLNDQNYLGDLFQRIIDNIQGNINASAFTRLVYDECSENNYNNKKFYTLVSYVFVIIYVYIRETGKSYNDAVNNILGDILDFTAASLWENYVTRYRQQPYPTMSPGVNDAMLNNFLSKGDTFRRVMDAYRESIGVGNRAAAPMNNYTQNNRVNSGSNAGIFNNTHTNHSVNNDRSFISGRAATVNRDSNSTNNRFTDNIFNRNTVNNTSNNSTNSQAFKNVKENSYSKYYKEKAKDTRGSDMNDNDNDFEHSRLKNELLDKDFLAKWYPTTSQLAWCTYDPTELICFITYNDEGHPIQEFTERNLTMEEKEHMIREMADAGYDPNLRPKKQENKLSKLNDSLKALSKNEEELNKLFASESKNKESAIPYVVDEEVKADDLKAALLELDKFNSVFSDVNSDLLNFKLMIANPVITKQNYSKFVSKILNAVDIRDARRTLIKEKDNVDYKLWTIIERKLTKEINSVLKNNLLLSTRIDSIIEDLSELLEILDKYGVVEEFNDTINLILSKLWIDIDYDSDEKSASPNETDNDTSDGDYNITLLPELINVTYVRSDLSLLTKSIRGDAPNIINRDENRKLYDLVKWLFIGANDKYVHRLVTDVNGKIFSVYRSTMNKEAFIIVELPSCD
jgi:hypothetical protein